MLPKLLLAQVWAGASPLGEETSRGVPHGTPLASLMTPPCRRSPSPRSGGYRRGPGCTDEFQLTGQIPRHGLEVAAPFKMQIDNGASRPGIRIDGLHPLDPGNHMFKRAHDNFLNHRRNYTGHRNLHAKIRRCSCIRLIRWKTANGKQAQQHQQENREGYQVTIMMQWASGFRRHVPRVFQSCAGAVNSSGSSSARARL